MNWPQVNVLENDGKHQYFYQGKRLQHVTELVELAAPPFETAMVAARVAARRQVPVAQVLQEWTAKREAAAQLGRETHSVIADRLTQVDAPVVGAPSEVRQWESWQNKYTPTAVFVEQLVYDLSWQVVGRFDALLHLPNYGLTLVDWKTGGYSTWGFERMQSPFSDLYNSKQTRYALQLSLYRLLLEKVGVFVTGVLLVHLEADRYTCYFDLPDYRRRVSDWLDQLTEIPF